MQFINDIACKENDLNNLGSIKQLVDPLDKSKFIDKQKKTNSIAPIIIVGNGPVGVKVANLLSEKLSSTFLYKQTNRPVIVFGEEKQKSYNRVQLTNFLSDEISEHELDNPIKKKSSVDLTEHNACKIISINKNEKVVVDYLGSKYHYSKLILATGSRSKKPDIKNLTLNNIYLFRTKEDAVRIKFLKQTCTNFIIVGGGPLGLEVATAIKNKANNVSLQIGNSIFSPNLSKQGQLVISDYIEECGINLISNNPLAKIVGKKKINQVQFKDGKILDCDCLIYCIGIVPETSLAESAHLKVNHGTLVNEFMLTSDPDIYAVGECCEFESTTYGVISPGFKQAKTCVEHIWGNLQKFENFSVPIKLKFNNYSSGCYGRIISQGAKYVTYSCREKGIYRNLVLQENIIVGAIIIGDCLELSSILEAITFKQVIEPAWLELFKVNGLLFETSPSRFTPHNGTDIICLCENVNRHTIDTAIQSGACSIESLSLKTGASLQCGSCKPQLLEILGLPTEIAITAHRMKTFYISILSILISIVIFITKPIPLNSFEVFTISLETLWFDFFWKQLSGYSLLAVCFLATLLSVKKRILKAQGGDFNTWRFVHTSLGYLTLVILIVHTGMRFGNNLNFALILTFLLIAFTGAIAGLIATHKNKEKIKHQQQLQLWSMRTHQFFLWLFPPLIIFHIISAYYF